MDNREVFKPKNAKCGTCHKQIAFYKLPSGAWCPCNIDGSDHFDQCRADWFETVKRDGVWFERKGKKGYHHKGKEILTQITSPAITGKDYKPTACTCLPWEDCTCEIRT